MPIRSRALVLLPFAAAVVVFCIVQDRVTAGGARFYVARQREALAGRVTPLTIDQVMRPAVERSVRQGLIWGGVVLIGGLGAAAVLASPRRSANADRPASAGSSGRTATRPREGARSGDRRE